MRLTLLFIIILCAVAFLPDFYIWWDIRSYHVFTRRRSIRRRQKRKLSWIYAATCPLGWALLIVALCLPRRSDAEITPVMWLLYIFLSLYVPKLVFCIFSLLGRIPLLWKGKRYYSGLSLGLPIGICIFIVMWWGVLVTRHEIEVNEITVASQDIPKEFNDFKILQFSDLHVGTWGKDTTFVSNMVDSINALKPDMIVFTGDIVNRNSGELKPFMAPLSRLKAPYGVYSILGNHDYGMYQNWPSEEAKEKDVENLVRMQKKMGWKILLNQYETVRKGKDAITIVGVENWGEPPFDGKGNLDMALKTPYEVDTLANESENHYKVLLTHNPEHWNRIVSKRGDVGLSLAGHTHAMQLMLKAGQWKWSPAQWKYPLWEGLYDAKSVNGGKEDVLLYVNIGAGEVALPSRLLWAHPELTLITLEHGK